MKREISPKSVVLTFGVLVVAFLAAFYAIAWQEPSQAPPGGNVPTPLNVGPTGQSKEGGLILNTGGAATGLIIDKGQVCIGADCRATWPETGVVTTYYMEASNYQVGNEYFAGVASYDCPAGSSVVNISCSENMVDTKSDQGCTEGGCGAYTKANSCSCSGSDNKATLEAKVIKYGGYCGDCTYGSTCGGRWAVSYCKPSVTKDQFGICWYRYDCQLVPGTPQCWMEFQCGIKETVGQ